VKPKPLLCRLGRHLWRRHHNDEGEPFDLCERCGKYHEPFTLSDSSGGIA